MLKTYDKWLFDEQKPCIYKAADTWNEVPTYNDSRKATTILSQDQLRILRNKMHGTLVKSHARLVRTFDHVSYPKSDSDEKLIESEYLYLCPNNYMVILYQIERKIPKKIKSLEIGYIVYNSDGVAKELSEVLSSF